MERYPRRPEAEIDAAPVAITRNAFALSPKMESAG
jgi:hypothetical protein